MKFVYLEEVLRLLVDTKECPSKFVDFFDTSSLLIGFNFCNKKQMFTHISHSFKKILGYESDNILYNTFFLDRIIHPQDRPCVQRYLFHNSVGGSRFSSEIEHGIPRIKCRCRHIKDYWKYLIFFSIDNWNEKTQLPNKIGLIADQRFKSFLHLMSSDFKQLSKKSVTLKEVGDPGSQICVSRREVEILELIGKGMIAKHIASELHISTSTVITHKKNLIEKFNVNNTAELVKISTQLMLV